MTSDGDNTSDKLPAITAGEELLTLTEATKVLPPVNGKRHAVSTLWRWCKKGIHGVRLEHLCIGRNLVTSRQALDRYFVALASAPLPASERPTFRKKPLPARPQSRQQAIEEAERILREAGL